MNEATLSSSDSLDRAIKGSASILNFPRKERNGLLKNEDRLCGSEITLPLRIIIRLLAIGLASIHASHAPQFSNNSRVFFNLILRVFAL